MKTSLSIPLLFLCLSANAFSDELLFPNSDFETGTLAGWTVEGEAFAVQPTKGDNVKARGRGPCNLQGTWWIGSFEKYNGVQGKPGDIAAERPTGTLTSDEFVISKRYITFRVGGGHRPGKVGVRLLIGDQTIELTTGRNEATMENFSADVESHIGKTARLQVFDDSPHSRGYISVDNFRAADVPAPEPSPEFSLTRNISASAYPETGYAQPHRPQFHFMSKKNWLNDPNGMVFDGEDYHLFFQHNPLSTKWGNMTWGHATSKDMIHWTQHDHALRPYRVDGRTGTIFSGTAVIDHNNSLGKQVGDTKTICAFYTFASMPRFYQAMAYSTDGGETFTYWNEGRAVVKNQGFDMAERDPKVFWHEASQHWVMALWVDRTPGRVRWFTSKKLTDWTVASDLMRDWAFECMDVVFLPVDGDKNNMKCVVYDASFDYEIGTFDGKTFHAESETLGIVQGNFYAAQSFNQAPNGRTVQIGWMRGGPDVSPLFDVPHNQQMSFPCDMSLRTTPNGIRLFCSPIPEIESLVTSTISKQNLILPEGQNALSDLDGLDLVDLEIEFSPENATQIAINLPHVALTYDVAAKTLSHSGISGDGKPATTTTLSDVASRDGRMKLRILSDRLSVEAFAFDGETFAAHYVHPVHGQESPALRATGGDIKIHQLTIRKLKSAWKK